MGFIYTTIGVISMPWKDKRKRNAWFKKRRKRLRSEGLCTVCGKNKPEKDKVICEECLEKWRGYGKKYHASPKYLKWRVSHRNAQKLKAMQIVSGLEKSKCVYCDCDDIRVLEINHKFGGGTKERKKSRDWSGQYLYHAIIHGRRKTNDLEITCRVCNARHYCNLKYPELSWKVEWIVCDG